jgi:hypothetical protein
VRHGPFLLRATALLSAGMLVVHDLPYRLPSGHGDHTLHAHSHGYLSAVAPLVALLLIVAAGQLIWLLARGGSATSQRRSTRMVWLLAAVTLVGAFLAQELVEGALAHHHPAGLAGIIGSGGWIAAPVSVLVGGAIALLLRGADAALRVAGRAPITLARTVDAVDWSHCGAPDPAAPRRSTLAVPGAGRAPPLACV